MQARPGGHVTVGNEISSERFSAAYRCDWYGASIARLVVYQIYRQIESEIELER